MSSSRFAASSLIPCLCGLLLAVPAAAQQRAAPAAKPAPLHPARLVPPSAADLDRERVPAGRVPIAEQDNMAVGVGIFSVAGHFVRERGARGREPLIDPNGRENRVVAAGFSLRF